MLGSFYTCQLRLEVPLSAAAIRPWLTEGDRLGQWLWPLTPHTEGGEPVIQLREGDRFATGIAPLRLHHEVITLGEDHLRLRLSGAIDGYHEWCWGDRWLQSHLEGISLLPCGLLHNALIWQLRQHLPPVPPEGA